MDLIKATTLPQLPDVIMLDLDGDTSNFQPCREGGPEQSWNKAPQDVILLRGESICSDDVRFYSYLQEQGIKTEEPTSFPLWINRYKLELKGHYDTITHLYGKADVGRANLKMLYLHSGTEAQRLGALAYLGQHVLRPEHEYYRYDDNYVEAIKHSLQNDPSPAVRARAARIAVTIRPVVEDRTRCTYSPYVNILQKALREDPSTEVRAVIAESECNWRTAEIALDTQEDMRVRAASAAGLARYPYAFTYKPTTATRIFENQDTPVAIKGAILATAHEAADRLTQKNLDPHYARAFISSATSCLEKLFGSDLTLAADAWKRYQARETTARESLVVMR